MKEISQTIKNLGRENIDIAMEIFISASSKKERNMALAKCSSPMATNTKECGRMVLSMAKGSTTGAMEITMRVDFGSTKEKEKVSFTMKQVGDMKATGKTIKNRGKVYCFIWTMQPKS